MLNRRIDFMKVKIIISLLLGLVGYISAFIAGIIILSWVILSIGDVKIAFAGTYSPSSKDTHFILIMFVIGGALTVGGWFGFFGWLYDYENFKEKSCSSVLDKSEEEK